MAPKKVAVIVGSLRKESLSRKMAKNVIDLAPQNLKLEVLEIGDLQLYNQDLEAQPPRSWVEFRNRLKSFDGVIFVTPEYNRSIPGVLKNAIDIGSRPYRQNVWAKKPAAIISVSPGALGGFGANHHLRQSLVFLDMPAMQQPEAYIGHADEMFDVQGRISKVATKDFISKFLKAYDEWVYQFSEYNTETRRFKAASSAENEINN